MADDSKKTLEMRVAELEDKLSKIHITEDEMKAFQRVSGLIGGGAPAPAAAPCIAAQSAVSCIAAHSACIAAQAPSTMHGCIVSDCIVNNCISGCWTECWSPIRQCIRQCCIFQQPTFKPGGGGFSGGGFGSLGG
jgi:hypothetical protein